MSRILKYLVFFFLLGMLVIISGGVKTYPSSQSAGEEEVRAVFLHDSMFGVEKAEAVSKLKNILSQYVEIGINNIFCFYDLSRKPREYDFLEVLLEEAHLHGIKVHPILHPGYRVRLEGEIKQHPEWLIKGKKGEMYPHLNLAHPDARDYALRQIAEILEYDVDGINLDYIRFPIGQRFSYDEYTCSAFKKEFGQSPLDVVHDSGEIIWCEWIKWNTEQITTFVRETKAVIQKSGKDIPLSVDVFPDLESAKVEIAQDWGKWAQEGIVDILCPMIYTNNLDLYRKYVKDAVYIANGKCLVYPTIACISSHNKNTPEGVARSVEISREEGAEGVAFFSGYSLTDEFMSKLKSTVFFDK
jgi:uncharacterized lipoprotein YddW (UPF0748 family)